MNKIEIKRLLAQSVSDQIMVLDAVRTADTKAHQDIRVFLTSRGTANTMSFVAKDQCCAVQKLQGDAVVDIRSNDLTSTATVPLTGTSPSFSVNGTECAAFSGCNAVIGHRNGESVESLAEWLQRLHEWHGMNAAIVIERQPPDMVEHAAVRLARALQDRGVAGLRIVLLCAESALGRLETGPEWHPFLAPDAPGKDRMRAPEPDPWTAPLGVSSIYEAIRARFLNTARAVLNLEVCDLVGPLGTRATDCEISETVFDRAVAAPEGYVTLSGRRVYPWSLSAKGESRFSDHICWRFDDMRLHRRWCVAPARVPDGAVWRQTRVFGAHETAARAPFWRCMALRYGVDPAKGQGQVSRIVPKSSLVECPPLLALSARLDAAPKRMPAMTLRSGWQRDGRIAVVSTMKNEGPFLLEWIAYHRSIGVQDFVIYTNDCDDGTDHFLQLLQNKGILQHRDNPYRAVNMKPQHAALAAAETEPLVQHASWLICMDVDEYINIHVGQGHLRDLIAAVPDANMISMTWRLFGNNDISSFEDRFVTEQFTRCAPEMARKPHQAWGFKTLYANLGIFRKMGVHRPKGLQSQLVEDLNWVNGSGLRMPREEYRNAWRSTTKTVGYQLATLNHYAVRSAESFLVKRDRGRVNHVDRDQGSAYWFRMNNNGEEDYSIQKHVPRARAAFDALLSDPAIASAHAKSVAAHRTKIESLCARPAYAQFFEEITGPRMRALSRLHKHFGSSVFFNGPDVVPDSVWTEPVAEDYFLVAQSPKTS